MLKNRELATGADSWCWPKGLRPRETRMISSDGRIATVGRLEPRMVLNISCIIVSCCWYFFDRICYWGRKYSAEIQWFLLQDTPRV